MSSSLRCAMGPKVQALSSQRSCSSTLQKGQLMQPHLRGLNLPVSDPQAQLYNVLNRQLRTRAFHSREALCASSVQPSLPMRKSDSAKLKEKHSLSLKPVRHCKSVRAQVSTSEPRPEEQQGVLKQIQVSLAQAKPTPAEAVRMRKAALGVAFLVGTERGLAAWLKTSGAKVSAPVLMLAAIAIAMSTPDAASRHMYNLFEPALAFFDAWLPAFFVPSVVSIMIAEIPTGINFVMVVLVTVATYVVTLWSSALLVNTITRAQGGRPKTSSLSHEQRAEKVASEARAAAKRLAERGSKALAGLAVDAQEADVKKAALSGARFLDRFASSIPSPKKLAPPIVAHLTAAVVLLGSAVAFPRTRGNFAFMAPGLIFLTTAVYQQCTRLPKAVKNVLSPTVLSGLLLSALFASYGSLCFGSWTQGIEVYTKGAGKAITLLIGPAVAALGFKVYIQRATLKKAVLQLAGVCFLITPLSLIFTAAAARVLGLSPHFGVPLLTETTTLGLALEMAGPAALACSTSLVVENVTACGTLGLNTARSILDSWKVRDPIARGAAVAASSHVLGTSSLMGEEPEAAAVAGLTVAMKGAAGVTLVCIPAFRDLLLRIVGAR